MEQSSRINRNPATRGKRKEHAMFALTLPKTLAATALAVAALGTASVAQAGLGAPQGLGMSQGLTAPQKHPDAQKHPDVLIGLKRPHIMAIGNPNIIAVGKPDIIAVLKNGQFCRKAGAIKT